MRRWAEQMLIGRCIQHVQNHAEVEISLYNKGSCNHFVNMLCSGERAHDCIQCMINRDNASHNHQAMLSDSTIVSPEEEAKNNHWDNADCSANIELTSEGEEENEAGERTGEYVHLCVPLTAGCVQITVQINVFQLCLIPFVRKLHLLCPLIASM